MIRIKGDLPLYVDCDDCLIKWSFPLEESENAIHISAVGEPALQNICVVPNTPMIECLKAFRLRGSTILVWSQSGESWANAVVEALGLESIVTATVTKPFYFLDDLPASAFMPESRRIYRDKCDPKTAVNFNLKNWEYE